MRRGNSTRTSQGGFTLLELLVAMTVLALLMSILFGGLRFGARVWETGDARAQELSELGVVHGFLRRLLAQAYPASLSDPPAPKRLAFIGTSDGATFVGLAPAHLATGGFYLFALELADGDDGRGLVLTWQPFRAGENDLVLDDATRRKVLLEPIESASFAYLGWGSTDGAPQWQDHWEDDARLPALIRLRLTLADRPWPWPDLVVRPMIDAPAGDPMRP